MRGVNTVLQFLTMLRPIFLCEDLSHVRDAEVLPANINAMIAPEGHVHCCALL